jgi:hypothetical protein
MLGIVAWPILLPSWFPEMARLGNDSLTALLLAGASLVAARAVGPLCRARWRWAGSWGWAV